MADNGLPFWTRVKQVAWAIVLTPFLWLFGLLSSVGHAGKRSGYSDKG